MPEETSQNIVSYRAGALTNELQLPGEMKPFFERAFTSGVDHNVIRRLDVQHHTNLGDFQNAIGDEIRKVKGIS